MSELVEITIKLRPDALKWLDTRAAWVKTDRAVEGGRLVRFALLTTMKEAAADLAPRTYTQQQFDGHMAGMRKRYVDQLEKLKTRIAELEASGGRDKQ